MASKIDEDDNTFEDEEETLADKVECLPDSRDDDVNAHLKYFFRNFRQNVALGEFNLLSKESADEAIKSVGETVERLNAQLKVVQSLKRLLEAQIVELEK
jgi:hypothetical protein